MYFSISEYDDIVEFKQWAKCNNCWINVLYHDDTFIKGSIVFNTALDMNMVFDKILNHLSCARFFQRAEKYFNNCQFIH